QKKPDPPQPAPAITQPAVTVPAPLVQAASEPAATTLPTLDAAHAASQPPPAPAEPPPAASPAPPSARTITSPPMAAADDGIRPKANPNAVVVARTQQSGDRLRLELPFPVPAPAAVFQRADTLWLVFDSPAQIDLTALQADNDNGVREVLFERGDDGAAIVRIKLAGPRRASLEADGPAWIVNIADTTTAETRPLAIARSIVGKNRASIGSPFASARAIHP